MSSPKILVVDDNEITRKLVRLTLSSEGYTVVEAQDGASAVQALRNERPNLILQDMILPDTGGIELVERLRNEPLGAIIPILAFSGFQSEMELADKLRVGFTDFLFKPVEPARLIQVVRAYLPMEPGEQLAPAAGARVVLADDDPVQLKLSSLHLQRKGYRVTIAHDGREAWEAVQEMEPDAVVSDVLMPGMDGFTLCLSIKQDPRLDRVPVVLTSSVYTEQPDRELATQVGAFDLVQRTPDLAGVIEALGAALSSPGGKTRATTQEAPTGAYLHRVVRQLERQVEENLGHARRLFLLEAELSLLGALSEQLAQDAPLPESLSELLQRCLDSAGLSSGVIWRVEGEQPVILAGIGIRLGHQLSAETCAALAEKLGSDEQPRLIEPSSGGREPERLALEQLEARSILVTPLRVDEQPVGGLLLASAQEALGGDWPIFARTIANHVSNAMAQARHREAEAAHMAAVEARQRETQLLLDVEQSLLMSEDLQSFLEESADRILTSGPYDVAAIQLVDQDGNQNEWRVARGFHDPGHIPALFRERPPTDPGAPRLRGLSDLEPTVIEDIVAEGRFHSLQGDGVRSVLWLPIRSETALLGRMVLGLREPRPITATEIALLASIGNHLGVAAQKAQLYEDTRRALEERDQAEGQLRQASKMEAIGNLAGGVAHDFNNLLTAIIGFGEMALDEDAVNETVRGYVQEMVKAGERAAALTRQLLAFSRRQVLRPEVINLNGVVENMDRLLQRVIGEHIDLKTRLQDDLSYARADPGQIEQVILNLAVNARDAMEDGGQLTIETRNCSLDQTYASEHAEVSAGPYVLLSVTDTGSGISPEVLAHIFEPFFTTKEQGKGTGLGLATVYGIVKQSGGHLSVYSEVGIGTTFKVYLPKVDAPAEVEAPAPPAAQPERASQGATILLVEDELGVRALARAVLGSAGYSVMEASSPDEALRLIERLNRPVELMVTDVVMPGMNGPALAARVRERWPGMKVIFMSGYPGDPLRRQGTIGEDAPYLEKPFTPKALRAKVQEVLESDS